MILLLFDLNERLIAEVSAITACEHSENADGNTVTITGYGIPQSAEYCAFQDVDSDLQLFRIMTRTEDKISKAITLYAENAYYELLTDSMLIDVKPTAVTAGVAVSMALNGSRWSLGTLSTGSLTASTRWYYKHRLAALADLAETWGIRYKFRIEVSGVRIEGRYVDISPDMPVWRGKRFEIGKDILEAKYTVDKRNVVTAIIGRGKGNETGDEYVERLTFKDVEWSVANGDPVDKPLGQEYVEIPEATALYGVLGTRPLFTTKTYSDIDDPEELLQATYNDLVTACQPTVSAALTVYDLERIGFPHEAARYGDEVALITDDVRCKTQVVGVKRDYADRGKDTFQLGALGSSMYKQIAHLTRSLAETDEKALAGVAVVKANQSLLQGYIDTMVTRILSTGTNMYTDPDDGGLVFVSDDETTATKITGRGFLIASSQLVAGGGWDWSTAIDGAGIVASMVTSGILQANLIKIVGTDQFYWDAGNIVAQDPTDTNRQLRFGCYDGTNLGIALTTDGGTTWTEAITFTGVTATHLNAATGTFTGTLEAGGWTFDSAGATYEENGSTLFQVLFDSVQGAMLASDLTKRLFIQGKDIYFYNASTSGYVVLGKDPDAGYTQQCFFPIQTRTGNLGTPSHIWDTASIRAVFRESEGGLSSRKIKKKIRKLGCVSRIIDKLEAVSFIYRADPRQKRHYGMIYEDTEKVAPLLCVQLRDDDDNPRNLGIDYSSLTILLLREVQDLRKRVKAVESMFKGGVKHG